MNPVDALVEEDPRVLAAYREWSGCMREVGFDYEDSGDAEDDIADRLEAILGDQAPDDLTGTALQSLTTLQEEERRIAQADFDCLEQHVEDVIYAVALEVTGAPPN